MYDKKNGKKIKGKESLKKSIDISMDMEHKIHKLSNWPIEQYLEYEKTFWPFVLISKKRYIGNKYEFDINKYKQISMGVVTKRRDNAPIVKIIYGGILDIIMDKKNISGSIKFLQNNLLKLIQGNFPIDKLIVSKTVKSTYKSPNSIAHWVLARRIEERTNIKIPSNTRIPYVYIKIPDDNKKKKVLQADKIEDPTYVQENKKIEIDYNYYITNQIMKPVCQIYALIIAQLKNYKESPDYFLRQAKKYKDTGRDDEWVKEKIRKLKSNMVGELLFDPIIEQVAFQIASVKWAQWGFQMNK